MILMLINKINLQYQNKFFSLNKNIFLIKDELKTSLENRKNCFTSTCRSCRVMWHGKYFNWLEESRINALSEVGISYFELTKNGLDLPLINTSIKYKSPLFLGEKIRIESEFNIDKSPRINVISRFHNKKNEILTIAEVNLVLINKLNFSIIRKRPDFLSEAFSKLNG